MSLKKEKVCLTSFWTPKLTEPELPFEIWELIFEHWKPELYEIGRYKY